MSEWQPIETAPDETEVLLWEHGIAFVGVLWRNRGEWYSIPGSYTANPTHWMPLPPAPTESERATVRHPQECVKVLHDPARTGYLHRPNDDSPYDVDGVRYCGRCHYALEPWR